LTCLYAIGAIGIATDMLKTHDLFNKHLCMINDDDKCKMYYSKMVDKFYEGCYGGWNYPTRGQRIIVNGKKELAPLLWLKRVPDEDPSEHLLVNALGGQFRAPTVVVRPLSESVVKDVKARNTLDSKEQPGPSTSGSSRTSTSTSRTSNNKRIRAEESMVNQRKKLKRTCTSRSSDMSSDIVNLSDDDVSKQEDSSDQENTPLKDVRKTKFSNKLCLQINFVFKYTFLLHLAEER
jgi:hypothetical protein